MTRSICRSGAARGRSQSDLGWFTAALLWANRLQETVSALPPPLLPQLWHIGFERRSVPPTTLLCCANCATGVHRRRKTARPPSHRAQYSEGGHRRQCSAMTGCKTATGCRTVIGCVPLPVACPVRNGSAAVLACTVIAGEGAVPVVHSRFLSRSVSRSVLAWYPFV